MRSLRFIPEGGAMVEVTYRTLHRRFLLRPSRLLNESIIGILARAKARFGVRVYGVVVMSNHLHLLIGVDDAEQMADFMCVVGGKLAKEVKRSTGWGEKIWSRRYQAIVVSGEEAAQVARLRYVLAHGVKEGLVTRPGEWPGVHCASSLMKGKTLRGYWFDRTRECKARQRGDDVGVYDFADREILHFEPLPCWAHLAPETYRGYISDLVEEVVCEGMARNEARGREPLGAAAVLGQDPLTMPSKPNRLPAPRFHAATRRARRGLLNAYSTFVAAYRDAAEQLRAGIWPVSFPVGSFPPGLPFVRGPALARAP